MKDKISPLSEEQSESIPRIMQNLYEDTVEDTAFDFAALDTLLGENEEIPESSELLENQEFSREESLEETDDGLPPRSELPAQSEDPGIASEPPSAKPNRFPEIIRGSKKAKCLSAIAAILLMVLLTLAGFFIHAALDPFDNRILDNTTIGGIPVGGMTQWEAYKAVKDATATTFTQQSMEVALPNATISLAPDQTKAKLSIWPTIQEAYRLGRKGTDEEKQAAVATAAENGSNIDLLPHMTLDQNYIRTQLEEYAAQYNMTYSEVSYQLTGTQPPLSEDAYTEDAPGQTLQLTLGTPLMELDVDGILMQILDAYNRNTLSVTIESIPPLSVPPQPDLEAISQEFLIAPVDAGVDLVNYTVVPGSYGYGIDMEAADKLIAEAAYGETISIPMKYTAPEIMGDDVYFRDELGYCETPHTNNENRNTNLRLACAAIDGLILQPGEEFSFNGIVGERTKEKGYLPAAAYSGTKTVNSIGGGVCQVSTTVYNAALLGDMEIIFRINHGFRSGYIGIGLDATVNWGGPDFQFRNNSHFPIMIKAEVSDGYVKVRLLGTDEKDYYIVMTSGYSEEDDYYTAWSYKNKYDKETGELISKEREAFSRYMK